MAKIDEITRESWIMSSCPEWGTWLNEEIEEEEVQPGNVAMWWLGCTGLWVKTPGGCNISIDLWCGNGKRSKQNKYMAKGHQMANMCGGRLLQPNLRATPFVIDPFAVKHVDAVLATHYHQDHMDPNLSLIHIYPGKESLLRGALKGAVSFKGSAALQQRPEDGRGSKGRRGKTGGGAAERKDQPENDSGNLLGRDDPPDSGGDHRCGGDPHRYRTDYGIGGYHESDEQQRQYRQPAGIHL